MQWILELKQCDVRHKYFYIKCVTEPERAGEGLIFKHDMKTSDINGMYETYIGGQHLKGGRIKSERHLS